jgi:hypothetical protein
MANVSKTHAVILYDKTLYAEDAAVVERILLVAKFERISHVDIREPHVQCDIQIHIRIPIYSAVSWAHKNIVLKHPAQWVPAYDAYLHAFDVYDMVENPWCSWMKPSVPNGMRDVGCFITNDAMFEYILSMLPYWRKDDPHVTVYANPAHVKAIIAKEFMNVTAVEYDPNTIERCYKLHMAHLVCSQENIMNYSALHSLAVGAFIIANALPYHKELYKGGVGWLSNEYDYRQLASPTLDVRRELDAAFFTYSAWDNKKKGKDLLDVVYERMVAMLRFSAKPMLGTPVLAVKDCPPITVITSTYHRKGLIDIAFHNMLTTDYPTDKMEWIIVEDTDIDKKDQMATDKIINFQVNHPTISIKYIPIEGRVSIGEKRNYGVKHATHNIILFMDDDDHCPITAFRRRVAWLLHSDRDIVCCTTLPLYDLKTGISAVSIPPFHLPLSQRISEATLTFTKAMWLERPFPDVSVAEGESWIQGREANVVEIPPQQIIVAFTHGTNQSSRIVPNGGKVSCFWGFPDEYLHFIHGLADVTIIKK